MRKRSIVFLALLASVLGLGLRATWIEPRQLVLKEVEIRVPDWPESLDGIRIAAIADLHVGSPHHGPDRLREIVQAVNAASPDVALVLGDLVIGGVLGGSFVEPGRIAAELVRLTAPLGTYAVLGNHDWWYDARAVAEALRGAEIPVLDDRSVAVEAGGAALWLAGVSDYWEGAHDVEAALADVPDGAPVVVFTHNPDVFPDVPVRVGLTIAGHTHGGQVRLPWIGPPVVPSRYGQRYAAGHVVEEGRHLFVTTGTGTSILPVRFLVPPEVAVVVVRTAGRPPPASRGPTVQPTRSRR